jgi:hypothetical protein
LVIQHCVEGLVARMACKLGTPTSMAGFAPEKPTAGLCGAGYEPLAVGAARQDMARACRGQ